MAVAKRVRAAETETKCIGKEEVLQQIYLGKLLILQKTFATTQFIIFCQQGANKISLLSRIVLSLLSNSQAEDTAGN